MTTIRCRYSRLSRRQDTNIRKIIKADYQSKSALVSVIIDKLQHLGYADNNFVIKLSEYRDYNKFSIVRREYQLSLDLRNMPMASFAKYICLTQCYDEADTYNKINSRTRLYVMEIQVGLIN